VTDPLDDEIALANARLAALHEKKALRSVRKCSSDESRDKDRCNVHAAFCALVLHLEFRKWSRRQIADVFDVHPVTLKDWIENGDRQRDQLPGWVIAAMTRLPRDAWDVFIRELMSAASPRSERTGTSG